MQSGAMDRAKFDEKLGNIIAGAPIKWQIKVEMVVTKYCVANSGKWNM